MLCVTLCEGPSLIPGERMGWVVSRVGEMERLSNLTDTYGSWDRIKGPVTAHRVEPCFQIPFSDSAQKEKNNEPT